LKTSNDIAPVRRVGVLDAWPAGDTLLADDPYDGEYGIFPEPKSPAAAEAGSRARSRIRAFCGLAAASAWMILAAAIGVLLRI